MNKFEYIDKIVKLIIGNDTSAEEIIAVWGSQEKLERSLRRAISMESHLLPPIIKTERKYVYRNLNIALYMYDGFGIEYVNERGEDLKRNFNNNCFCHEHDDLPYTPHHPLYIKECYNQLFEPKAGDLVEYWGGTRIGYIQHFWADNTNQALILPSWDGDIPEQRIIDDSDFVDMDHINNIILRWIGPLNKHVQFFTPEDCLKK